MGTNLFALIVVIACFAQDIGYSIMHPIAVRTDALNPKKQYVPCTTLFLLRVAKPALFGGFLCSTTANLCSLCFAGVVLNGKPLYESFNNILAKICAAYTGKNRPNSQLQFDFCSSCAAVRCWFSLAPKPAGCNRDETESPDLCYADSQ